MEILKMVTVVQILVQLRLGILAMIRQLQLNLILVLIMYFLT